MKEYVDARMSDFRTEMDARVRALSDTQRGQSSWAAILISIASLLISLLAVWVHK
jgi:hypothetical protein